MLANITVREYMTANPVVFRPSMDVFSAMRILIEHRITGAPVLDEHEKVIGIFSEYECLRIASTSAYHEDMGGKVSEHMNTDIIKLDSDASILETAERFNKSSLRHFPVIEDGQLIGVISRHDILKALVAIRK